MKNLILIFTILILTMGITAQPSNVESTHPNGEDIKIAKEALKQYLEENNKNATPKQQSKELTMTDVLDKGVDSIIGFTTTLEGVISKYAPEVWRIMVTQQYSKAIGNLIFWGMMLFIPLIINYIGRKSLGAQKNEKLLDVDPTEGFLYFIFIIIPSILTVIFSIRFIYVLSESIMIVVNPEYYALRDIIQMLR